MSSKIIFLDIDGVLNCTADLAMGRHINTEKCTMLNRLCVATGAKIVISSTWRILYDCDFMESFLMRCGLTEAYPLAGATRRAVGDEPRGAQISDWLRYADVESYVIIDDDSDMLKEQLPYFVQTNYLCGFTWREYDKAFDILGAKT